MFQLLDAKERSMARASLRTKVGVESLEGRNLTTAFSVQSVSAQAVVATPGVVTVSQSASNGVGATTPTRVASSSPICGSLNPNPDDSSEPHGPGAPISRVGIIIIGM
jgi:hypothetical protein